MTYDSHRMNGIFYECFKLDLPSETTCYSVGPSSRFNYDKHCQSAVETTNITVDLPPPSFLAWRIATLHHSVTLSVSGDQKDILHASFQRPLHQKENCVVAYANLTIHHSPRFFPLEAFIYNNERNHGHGHGHGHTLEAAELNPIENVTTNKTRPPEPINNKYMLTFMGQASPLHKTLPFQIFGDLKSEIELSFTPLSMHLCPLVTKLEAISHKYYFQSLLLIGSLEEPYLKTFLLSFELDSSSNTISSNDRSTLFIQEVAYNHPYTTRNTTPIPQSLTPCFSITTGNEAADTFLPNSYWDLLIHNCMHTYNSQPHTQQQSSTLPLAFTSPVMGIHSMVMEMEDGPTHLLYLAISCQDGTIRTLAFNVYYDNRSSSPHYHILNVSDAIIDGPIITLALSSTQQTPKPLVMLSVGSLCGTASQFIQYDPCSSFQGPETIISMLWNYATDMEDSVTAIESQDNLIALGTFSGNILVFTMKDPNQDNESKSGFNLIMQQCLQYPIHSIHIDDVDDDGFLEMMVCSRKSVHLFRMSPMNKCNF